MIEFKKPQVTDASQVRKILMSSGRMGSESCFGNLYMWCNSYSCSISVSDDVLVCRAGNSYTVPVGTGDTLGTIDELIAVSKREGMPLRFHAIYEETKEGLESVYGDRFEFTEDRSSFDYIYSVKDLAELSGKKYHSKRNHISYFENTFDWSYEEMTVDTVPECLEFSNYWLSSNGHKLETGTDRELEAITRGLENFKELSLVGGILRVHGEIVAYTFGEKVNETLFCTHVEKASADIRGAYPMINREFAKNTISAYSLVNREEDLGIDGLRRAKESYHPKLLLKKYTAVLR